MGSFAQPDQPRISWLFLDLNSYFASVEQELQPKLRNRPVAVVPVMADTTCVIAASYEAKVFGVKTGTQVGDAKRMCPGITLVEGRHEIYADYHERVKKAVELCVPITAVCSIDEMAVRLLGREQPLTAALALARQIKQSIRDHAGKTLRCSIGLAPNRYLAKIASDMDKPDGLVALTPELLVPALSRLELRALPGVGRRMEKRLHASGIHTMPELLALSREQMNDAWGGVWGERVWHWLRGEDFGTTELEFQKSISHSHVLPPALRSMEGCYAVAHKLLHKAAIRLRKEKMWATNVSLVIKFVAPKDTARRTHSSGIPQTGWAHGLSVLACQDSQTLMEALCKVWAMRPQGPLYERPFFVGIWLGELVPDHLHTLSLFAETEEERRRARISSTMDAINSKYSLDTVMSASMLPAKTAAPTRIAFTSIPDLFENQGTGERIPRPA